ncbi:MAG: hypothetical protein IIY55_11665 [Blautia sp.]|nr:hypothetical protein [Blautia sp.]
MPGGNTWRKEYRAETPAGKNTRRNIPAEIYRQEEYLQKYTDISAGWNSGIQWEEADGGIHGEKEGVRSGEYGIP